MRTWTCPECGEFHVFPKNGPFKLCCLMGSLADSAAEVAGMSDEECREALESMEQE